MTKSLHARQSLGEETEQVLRQHFASAEGPRSRVLWWDAGGYLREVIQAACREMGIPFVEGDHPLKFRQWVAEQGDVPSDEPNRVVWYVPEAKQGRDWFRDVAAMGGIVEKDIEALAADLYNIQPWRLRASSSSQTVSEPVAEIVLDNLRGSSRPPLERLQVRLVIESNDGIVEYLLRNGWQTLPRHGEETKTIRSRLQEKGVPGLPADDDPDAMVDAVRRWAVAGWLFHEGAPKPVFPDAVADSDLGHAYRRLKAVLATDIQTGVLRAYQERFWKGAVAQLDNPWDLANCPVGGALDERLWSEWISDFNDGRFETCRERAVERATAFCAFTGREQEAVGKDSPAWIRVWKQAAALADLAHRYETWDDRDVPVHALYADREEGSWHIDAAVRRIIVSGRPEDDLPADHPARETLAENRKDLIEDAYLNYLQALAEEMEGFLKQGDLLGDGLASSVDFWADHEEHLDAGSEALFFYIDALRLDLARELADRLQERSDATGDIDINVEESTRLGTLPSETKFGMSAVLPGRSHHFEIKLEDGTLQAFRNGNRMNATKRRSLLKEEGWAVAPHNPTAWSSSLVAYVDTELDDIGEKNLDRIESKLAERVEQLADRIFEKMRQGDWNRAYVVADHGFVLLPERAGFEDLPAPDGDVKRRRVAADDLPDDDTGVLLTREKMPALSYLQCPVRVLLDPQQRYSKQGIPDSRYYHGGALPQECILSFLKIEAA